ncbi:MAG: hypothetical protein JJE04_09280 [Acidobacteriia bacterium]|nr:hypothetical protein [Terriglobia bacterium]
MMDDLRRLTCGKIVPAEMLEVVNRIQELYGDKLKVVSVDPNCITVQPRSITDNHLLKTMMDDQKKIFLKDQLNRFQILCPWDNRGGTGIMIHYLGHKKSRHLPGYWWI